MKNVILVSVDIEKAGPCLEKHPVVSVGFTVGDLSGTILEQQKFNFKVNWFTETEDGDFDHDCAMFWRTLDKNIIARCHSPAPVSPEIGWLNIASWINSLEIKYPSDTNKIKFVSDNASFDIANIDYNVEKYANRKPMRYSTTGVYRSVLAADDMFDMLPKKDHTEALAKINSKVVHDHDCINDSYHILLQYVYAYQWQITSNNYQQ